MLRHIFYQNLRQKMIEEICRRTHVKRSKTKSNAFAFAQIHDDCSKMTFKKKKTDMNMML